MALNPWPRKTSAFVILIRRDTNQVYMVKSTKNVCEESFGVPGGKGEDCDEDAFSTACREFAEETGADVPFVESTVADQSFATKYGVADKKHFYDLIMCRDQFCDCHFFYKILPADVAETLPVGASPDPQGSEEHILWAEPTSVWKNLRPHVKNGIKLVQAKSWEISNMLMPKKRAGKFKMFNGTYPDKYNKSPPLNVIDIVSGLEHTLTL